MEKMVPWCFLTFFILSVLTAVPGDAARPDKISGIANYPVPSADRQTRTLFNINNISGWIQYDGLSGYDPVLARAGVIYPRGTANVIFQDGFIWGGYSHDGQEPSLRVGGQTYNIGTQPGKILSVGVPQNLSDPQVRIYRIRPDWETAPDNELRRDAAELLNIDSAQVTQSQIDAVRAQYGTDWNEWPVTMGAPFYDLNGNGIYEPLMGETPGLANADQVIWFVCNDLNSELTHNLHGSPPIGLELQITIWAFKQNGALGQLAFRRYRLINKSGFLFDKAYIALWSDPDIGNGGDDFAGCDSVLNLGYAYNGYPADQEFQKFNVPPPAVGYDLLQGPIVSSPGDTAIFDFKKKASFKNLPMTSFTYFPSGSPWSDPPLRDYLGTLKWYKILQGYLPNNEELADTIHFTIGSGPDRGEPTLFPLSGDPVAGFGDIDGYGDNFAPGERRMILCSGPFAMQPGDTQEVVAAVVGGIGESNLLSVQQMKENDRAAQGAYDNLFEFRPTAVRFAARPDYLSESQTRVHFHAVNTDADAIQLSVRKYDGSEVAFLALYDDGLHGDGSAADGVFGNDWETAPLAEGLYVDAQVNYSGGQSYTWHRIQEALTTAGPVRITRFILGSDNLNHDGVANPGENIRYTLEIENQTAFDFSDLLIRPTAPAISPALQNLSAPRGDQIIPALTANSSFSWDYSSEGKFYQFDIASGFAGDDSVRIAVQLSGGQYNLWRDTVAIWIAALPVRPQDQLMTKVSGQCYGQLGCRLVDPAQFLSHTYQVSFNNALPGGAALFDLQDLTSGETLLTAQPYPDQFGHNSQVVDGFMVTRGTTVPYNKTSWDWTSSGERWLSGMGELSTFYGGFDLGQEFFGSTLTPGDYHSVEITFDPGLQTNCAVYRRDLGYQYSGTGIFYGAAYDISDSLNPRRVNIVFAEDNNIKPADLIWNPDTTGLGGREYLFIMDSDYDPVTAGGYNDTNFGPDADVVWGGWTRVKPGYSFLQTPADLYLFLDKAIGQGDVFQFTPQWTGTGSAGLQPLTFELFQNYPNPFNPVTHFRFNLARQVKVRLEVYNVLGQRVRTLIDREMGMGRYKVQWDGRNAAGNYMGSGVYFYRLSAGDYVKTRKMILMK